MKTIFRVLRVLALGGFVASVGAQEVSIPDPGLNAAIREALAKPAQPLTREDMLNLLALDASSRDIRSLAGLDAAENLALLSLRSNRLANLTLPSELTSLR
ncbi:MAG TPA: hypothetical protein VGR78_07845, partial [Verrucomicrobiae bacterium]|nr:hypothetical protein [Verrucomicrobiae bacterium]